MSWCNNKFSYSMWKHWHLESATVQKYSRIFKVHKVRSGKLTYSSNGKWTPWRCISYWKMGIIQPAMLVYQRVSHFLKTVIVQLGGGNSNICYFSPLLGEKNPIWLLHIFQMGRFNHQLSNLSGSLYEEHPKGFVFLAQPGSHRDTFPG